MPINPICFSLHYNLHDACQANTLQGILANPILGIYPLSQPRTPYNPAYLDFYLFIVTFTIEFPFLWVVLASPFSLSRIFFDFELFEICVISRLSLEGNFLPLVLVRSWPVGFWFLWAKLRFISGCPFKFCFPWNIAMLALCRLLIVNFFIFIIFIIFCFSIKLSWTRFVFIFFHLLISLLYLMRMVKLIIACLKSLWIIVSFLVLVSTTFIVGWLYFIGLIVMMIGCFTLKTSSTWFWAMVLAASANLANASSIVLSLLSSSLISWRS